MTVRSHVPTGFFFRFDKRLDQSAGWLTFSDVQLGFLHGLARLRVKLVGYSVLEMLNVVFRNVVLHDELVHYLLDDLLTVLVTRVFFFDASQDCAF